MSRYVTDEAHSLMEALMFRHFADTPRERFLREELVRYVPQMSGKTEAEVAEFIRYQRAVYLDGALPEIGRPIASLNPMFADSLDAIPFSAPGVSIRTRVSVKENGYRMQFHRGSALMRSFTRQFTPYDLRMFPELADTFKGLPLMIGDTELANAKYRHLAGFNRVEKRIDGPTHWPRKGQSRMSDEFIREYLSNPELFGGAMPHDDLRLTLAFHGLFAIAHPKTWDKQRVLQAQNMIPLCRLPIDHERIDELLAQLDRFIRARGLNARIAERFVPETPAQLKRYVSEKEAQGYEGVCIVRSARDAVGEPVMAGHAIKLKKYETFDMALLGLYLGDRTLGLKESNATGALLGLFDRSLGAYLPAVKVNLDPNGRQVKTDGQRERLTKLRREIVGLVYEKGVGRSAAAAEPELFDLHDVFVMQGEQVLYYLLRDGYPSTAHPLRDVVRTIPRTYDLASLYRLFKQHEAEFRAGTMKRTTAAKQFIHAKIEFFRAIDRLGPKGIKRFEEYFSKTRAIKAVSGRLPKPDVLVGAADPIVVEAQVFDIKWGASPFPAGFHSWYGDSFCFSNAFAERVRHDKNTTTDYETVYVLARAFTARKARKPRARRMASVSEA